jgi:hypothetical protein
VHELWDLRQNQSGLVLCGRAVLGICWEKLRWKLTQQKAENWKKNIPSDSHPNIVTELFLSFENHQKGFKRIQKV